MRKWVLVLVLIAALVPAIWAQRRGRGRFFEPDSEIQSNFPKNAEFHFIRVEYQDMYGIRRGFGGFGRGWWMQDWPAADIHFSQGIQRLTRIDIGDERHTPLTDDRVYEYPWIYATQTGYWNLNDNETARLRDYLERGGFLMTDDFHGPDEWQVFAESMERVYPGQQIEDVEADHPMMNILYEIKERTFIPGLRHLAYGPGGKIVVRPEYTPPQWKALRDSKGRLVVAVNFNQDIGDAWEHADLPEYPENMTRLAYYFGINYLVYAMTH